MDKDERKKVKDAAMAVAEIGISVKFGFAGAAALKILDRVLIPIATHVVDRREKRGARFAEELVKEFMDSGHPNETATSLLQTALERAPDATKDAVVDAIRTLDDVLSDAVVPTLALLARRYIRANQSVEGDHVENWQECYDGIFAALVTTGLAEIQADHDFRGGYRQHWIVKRAAWQRLADILPIQQASL